jgi:hypothetical protein
MPYLENGYCKRLEAGKIRLGSHDSEHSKFGIALEELFLDSQCLSVLRSKCIQTSKTCKKLKGIFKILNYVETKAYLSMILLSVYSNQVRRSLKGAATHDLFRPLRRLYYASLLRSFERRAQGGAKC